MEFYMDLHGFILPFLKSSQLLVLQLKTLLGEPLGEP